MAAPTGGFVTRSRMPRVARTGLNGSSRVRKERNGPYAWPDDRMEELKPQCVGHPSWVPAGGATHDRNGDRGVDHKAGGPKGCGAEPDRPILETDSIDQQSALPSNSSVSSVPIRCTHQVLEALPVHPSLRSRSRSHPIGSPRRH